MKQLIRAESTQPWAEHQADIERLVKVSREKGYELSEADAYYVWQRHSESMAATWMFLGSYNDDELWWVIELYMKEES
jgi:hypothetical protein